jgi:hypothetical protein
VRINSGSTAARPELARVRDHILIAKSFRKRGPMQIFQSTKLKIE